MVVGGQGSGGWLRGGFLYVDVVGGMVEIVRRVELCEVLGREAVAEQRRGAGFGVLVGESCLWVICLLYAALSLLDSVG